MQQEPTCGVARYPPGRGRRAPKAQFHEDPPPPTVTQDSAGSPPLLPDGPWGARHPLAAQCCSSARPAPRRPQHARPSQCPPGSGPRLCLCFGLLHFCLVHAHNWLGNPTLLSSAGSGCPGRLLPTRPCVSEGPGALRNLPGQLSNPSPGRFQSTSRASASPCLAPTSQPSAPALVLHRPPSRWCQNDPTVPPCWQASCGVTLPTAHLIPSLASVAVSPHTL